MDVIFISKEILIHCIWLQFGPQWCSNRSPHTHLHSSAQEVNITGLATPVAVVAEPAVDVEMQSVATDSHGGRCNENSWEH